MSKPATAELSKRGDPPLGLPKWLFWDVNPAAIDLEKHATYVVQRIIEFGTLEAWRTMKQYYGEDRLREVVTSLSYLTPRSVSFCIMALDLHRDDFCNLVERSFTSAPWALVTALLSNPG